jgi:hypothetical protein
MSLSKFLMFRYFLLWSLYLQYTGLECLLMLLCRYVWTFVYLLQASIECFRRALSVSPNNAEILLNLARVLFNLQYLGEGKELSFFGHGVR